MDTGNEIRIETVDGRVVVNSPYTREWPAVARNLGGRWQADPGVWLFDPRDERKVRNALRETYGWAGESGATVDVRLTAENDIEVIRGGVEVAGRTLARAFGRDGGARLGDGVVAISGHYGSGGSMNNWKTRIGEGAVFEVRDLPAAAIDLIDTRDWTVQIVDRKAGGEGPGTQEAETHGPALDTPGCR